MAAARAYGPIAGRTWSDEEKEVVRRLYVSKGLKACRKALPDRSERSILQAAWRMGLKTHRRWTGEEDRYIRSEWGYVSLVAIARAIGRTPKAVYQHARVDLDVGMGAPEGSEYLTAASKRTGFAVATLRKILAHAKVPIKAVPTRPVGRVSHRMHYVDPFEVDDAVKAWMDSEEIEPGAVSRGLAGETLRQWLLDAGVKCDTKIRRGRWRVPSTTIDRIVTERRALYARTESLSAAADRHGVPRGTLRYWLVSEGIRLKGKPWRLDPADADRVVAARRGRKDVAA